jgi:hypothetical protein
MMAHPTRAGLGKTSNKSTGCKRLPLRGHRSMAERCLVEGRQAVENTASGGGERERRPGATPRREFGKNPNKSQNWG